MLVEALKCQVDIRFEVTELRVQVAQCRCGKTHTGPCPAGVSQAVQYGPRVKVAAVYLTQYHDRAAQALRDLFGLSVSTGTIQDCINETASALAPALEQISQAMIARYIARVGARASNWMAVDDDDDGWPEDLGSRLIATDSDLGLSCPNTQEALRSRIQEFCGRDM